MKTRILVATAAIALVLAPLAVAGTTKLSPIEEKVRHELVMLPFLGVFDHLSFRVDGSTVTLFGAVTRPTLKSDAQNVVKGLEGVRLVKNEIEVLPLSRFDDQIRLRTYYAIYGYGPLNRYALGANPPIRILVKNGNVTLAGVVANEMDKNLAFLRASGVPGSFAIRNELRVEK